MGNYIDRRFLPTQTQNEYLSFGLVFDPNSPACVSEFKMEVQKIYIKSGCEVRTGDVWLKPVYQLDKKYKQVPTSKIDEAKDKFIDYIIEFTPFFANKLGVTVGNKVKDGLKENLGIGGVSDGE